MGYFAYRGALPRTVGTAVWRQFTLSPGGTLQWGLAPIGAFFLLCISGFCWAGTWCTPLIFLVRGGALGILLAFLPPFFSVSLFLLPIEILCLIPLLLQAGNVLQSQLAAFHQQFEVRAYLKRTAVNMLFFFAAQGLCLGWARLLLFG